MMLMKIILVIYTASEIMNLNILLDKPMKGHLNNVKLVSHDLRSGRKRKEGEKRNKKKRNRYSIWNILQEYLIRVSWNITSYLWSCCIIFS